MNFCTLASGSNGNSSILTGERHILIDIGYSNRAICKFMANIGVNHEDVGAIFITHEHSDHIKGLEVFLKNHPNCACFASRKTAAAIGEYHPEIADRVDAFDIGDSIDVLGARVDTIRTPHDTPESVSYFIGKADKKILIATDLGYVPDAIEQRLDKLDILMIESNYDENMLEYGHYPRFLKERIAGERGHLSNKIASGVVLNAVERGTKRVLLAHLSQENNTPRLAYEESHRKLLDSGFIPGVDVDLKVSPRGMCGEVIKL